VLVFGAHSVNANHTVMCNAKRAILNIAEN